MSRTKQMEATVIKEVATTTREFMGAKTISELPQEYVMARSAYLKEERNGLRQNNALTFLSLQNGFMFWFYKKIGNRESAVFEISGENCTIRKSAFLSDYKKAVAIMREKGEAVICNISFTKNGNVAVKAKPDAIAVLA